MSTISAAGRRQLSVDSYWISEHVARRSCFRNTEPANCTAMSNLETPDQAPN